RPAALTLAMLRGEASNTPATDIYTWLNDRKNRRSLPHRMSSCGYLPVASGAPDRLWVMQGKRQRVYSVRDFSPEKRFAAATELKKRLEQTTGDPSAVTPLRRADRQPK